MNSFKRMLGLAVVVAVASQSAFAMPGKSALDAAERERAAADAARVAAERAAAERTATAERDRRDRLAEADRRAERERRDRAEADLRDARANHDAAQAEYDTAKIELDRLWPLSRLVGTANATNARKRLKDAQEALDDAAARLPAAPAADGADAGAGVGDGAAAAPAAAAVVAAPAAAEVVAAAAVAATVLRRRATHVAAPADGAAADAPAMTEEEAYFRFFAKEALDAMNSWRVALFPCCCGFKKEAKKTAKLARIRMFSLFATLGLDAIPLTPPKPAKDLALWLKKAELRDLYAKVSNAIGGTVISPLILE